VASRLPYRAQVELADCGAACLSIVLEHFGKPVSLDEVKSVVGGGRDGTDALALVEGARWFGLRARGVQADIDDFPALETGSLLFWDMSHFVVLERQGRRGIDIVDPALGRRRVSEDQLRKSYAGVAILLEPGEHFRSGGRRRTNIGRHLGPLLAQGATLRRVVATSLLLRVLALGLPLLTGILVDRVVPQQDRNLLLVVGLSLAAVVAFTLVSALLRSWLLLELRTRTDEATTLGFLEHLVALPYTFHLRRSPGDMMMRLRSNAIVRELLTTGALSALLDGLFVFLYLALLLTLSLPLGLLVAGLGLFQGVVLLVARRPTQRLMAEGLQAEARSQGYAFQLFSGMGTIKASGAEGRAVERFANLFVDELGVSLARGRLSAVVESVMGALRTASPMAVLLLGGVEVLNGSISLGAALAINALAAGFLEPLSTLVTTGLSLQLLGSYLERLNDVLDSPTEQQGEDVRPAPELAGAIEARDLRFRYSPLAPLVIDGVSLSVAAGQTVALVGRSGSGKTTLAHLLVGLYQPEEGVVSHDGNDLRLLEAGTVRRQLGVVTQEPYLFGVSLRENIAFADPSLPLEAVKQAATRACVADDIETLPLGYDTVLSDGGSSLSGGQRQRVALARALASSPRVLLLDEATSHLDAITEEAVHRQLDKLECTTIVVAHRLSTVAGADVIVVLDGGRIVEQGTHTDLLERAGAYAELVGAQLSDAQRPRRKRGPWRFRR
jgi:ABC-type bacteriocin/lantibiotic exporter with double-glycine peptidase domain